MLLARMDGHGKAAWLGLTVLVFWTAWPLGLVVPALSVESGRMWAWREGACRSPGRWFNLPAQQRQAVALRLSSGQPCS